MDEVKDFILTINNKHGATMQIVELSEYEAELLEESVRTISHIVPDLDIDIEEV